MTLDQKDYLDDFESSNLETPRNAISFFEIENLFSRNEVNDFGLSFNSRSKDSEFLINMCIGREKSSCIEHNICYSPKRGFDVDCGTDQNGKLYLKVNRRKDVFAGGDFALKVREENVIYVVMKIMRYLKVKGYENVPVSGLYPDDSEGNKEN